MAGLGFKTFSAGNVLTAADLQGYAVDQSVMVFASAAARTTALASPSQGMVSFLTDSGTNWQYFDVYNASTNPGGAAAGGWYPISGAIFFGTATRSAASGTVYTIGASGYTYTENRDTLSWHSTVTNTDRITPTAAGIYRITCTVLHATNASGTRRVQLFKSATPIAGQSGSAVSPGSAVISSTAVIFMNGTTDYFNATSFQDSGSSLTATAITSVEFLYPIAL
jgi:hypothetical protein